VRVDEAWCSHLACGGDRRRRDRSNNSVLDPVICDLVEPGLRLHNPTVQDDGGLPVCGELRGHRAIKSIRRVPIETVSDLETFDASCDSIDE
jgi:hypothetical protein